MPGPWSWSKQVISEPVLLGGRARVVTDHGQLNQVVPIHVNVRLAELNHDVANARTRSRTVSWRCTAMSAGLMHHRTSDLAGHGGVLGSTARVCVSENRRVR